MKRGFVDVVSLHPEYLISKKIIGLIESLLCSLLEKGIRALLVEEVVDLVKISRNIVRTSSKAIIKPLLQSLSLANTIRICKIPVRKLKGLLHNINDCRVVSFDIGNVSSQAILAKLKQTIRR